MNELAGTSPFIRWAGSKSKLLKHLLPFVPPRFGTYFEPFFGSGALFFHLAPKKARVGDICAPLVNTYAAVRDDCEKVVSYLKPLKISKTEFYRRRAEASRGRFKSAANFIFLNKACWNGLYRVNLKGEFNVPFGRPKSPHIYDEETLKRCSLILAQPGVKLRIAPFEHTLATVKPGDFVFLDPPYVTRHNGNGFVEWNERIFSWADQQRLSEVARRLAANGAYVLVTNADHDEVTSLYKGFSRRTIQRVTTLASDTTKRVQTTEALLLGGAFGN